MKKVLLTSTILLFITCAFCQESFKAYLQGGIVAAQVEGDGYAGYNKLGALGGIGISRQISEPISLGFEMNYAQKGSRKNADPNRGDYYKFILRMNYVEVPIYLTYHLRFVHLNLGGYYGYLLSNTTKDNFFTLKNDASYNKSDIGGFIGMQIPLKEKWSVNIRSKASLQPIRTTQHNDLRLGLFSNIFKVGWYNMDLNFTVQYQLGNS